MLEKQDTLLTEKRGMAIIKFSFRQSHVYWQSVRKAILKSQDFGIMALVQCADVVIVRSVVVNLCHACQSGLLVVNESSKKFAITVLDTSASNLTILKIIMKEKNNLLIFTSVHSSIFCDNQCKISSPFNMQSDI